MGFVWVTFNYSLSAFAVLNQLANICISTLISHVDERDIADCTNVSFRDRLLPKLTTQGDLSEEDVMLLDNGKQVYVWFGKAASEVEKKLAVKSAQVSSRTSSHMTITWSQWCHNYYVITIGVHQTLGGWGRRREEKAQGSQTWCSALGVHKVFSWIRSGVWGIIALL